MKHNVGTIDQYVRIAIGLVILGIGSYYGSWWGILGLVIAATGAFRFCGIYALLGISTCPVGASTGSQTGRESVATMDIPDSSKK